MRSDASEVYRRYISALIHHGLAATNASGLNTTDFSAINSLTNGGSLTSGELAERTGLTTGATTRLIDRLERGGYVRRTTDPGDRRKVIVERVTDSSGLDEVLNPARLRLIEILESYHSHEQAVLFDYFTRATRAYEDATADLRKADPAPAAPQE